MERMEEMGAAQMEQSAVLPYSEVVATTQVSSAEEYSLIGRKLRNGVLATGLLFSGMAVAANLAPHRADATAGTGPICQTQTDSKGEQITGCVTGTATGLHFTWSGYNAAVWPNGVYEDTQFTDVDTNKPYSGVTECAPSNMPNCTYDFPLTNGGEYNGQFTISTSDTTDEVKFDIIAGGQGTPPPTNPCQTGITHLAPGEPWAVAPMTKVVNGTTCGGTWVATRSGGVITLGDAPFLGDVSGYRLNAPVVGIAATPDGGGYWLVAADGGIFSFGDAAFHGSTGGIQLAEPVVSMASTGDGRGYWLVAADGGIFSFGDAAFHGSTGGIRLNKPIVGMASTAGGEGYWLVAADGGIFSFGKAPFYGSLGNVALAAPIVGMSQQPDGRGYRMVGQDGGVFDFGDAAYYGSLPGEHVQNPNVTTMAPTVDGRGYELINGQGTIWPFGDAPNLGNA